MKRILAAVALLFCLMAFVQIGCAQELALDDLFPSDRVLDVQIKVDSDDWDTIRFQTRNIRKELGASRMKAPIEPPYTCVNATVTIDGVDLGKIGLRKKGFVGSQSSERPSLKIKLDYVDPDANIDGLASLTLNNNRQDRTVLYQFMGYAFFNAAGSPAPRCAFAKVTVNDKNLGVYSHVETVRQPILSREFGNDQGTLYEGTVVDFFEGWEGSFENKLGEDQAGRKKIGQLIEAMKDREGKTILSSNANGRAWIPTRNEYNSNWTEVGFDDSSWKAGKNGAGFETQTGYQSLISKGFDFRDELHNQSTSLCLRFPFEIDDLKQLGSASNLYLLMKYDDGFVAWLNGHRIAGSNDPRTPRWSSRATGPHEDGSALQFEWFNISAFKDKIRKGKNVLAIQALNSDKASSDMLCVAEIQTNEYDFEKAIAEFVELDAFYKFWAIEGLLGFWDGYSANRNNFFVYLNPESGKFHFMPWGADALFQKHGFLQRDRREPLCVKTTGMVAHKLYQSKAGRDRYAATMTELLEDHWDEDALLAEVDRIEAMVQPHLCESQKRGLNLRGVRTFIRTRREDVEREIADGLPVWTRVPGEPPIIPAGPDPRADNIWNAARKGDLAAIQKHLDQGVDVNSKEAGGSTPLSGAALLGRIDAVKMLIKKGADIGTRSQGNQTPIHLAAFLGQTKVVEFLLENGANTKTRNDAGQTPLELSTTPWSEVEPMIGFLSNQFNIKIDPVKVKDGRKDVAELLRNKTGKTAEKSK